MLALLLSLWYAIRYAKIDLDPDWACFNMWGFTGARYGYDLIDCKTPMIHWYYLLLSKIVGKNIARVRFLHHVLISAPGFFMPTWAGAAYVVLVNSGWLFGFHGNVGQQAAACFALAIAFPHPLFSPLMAFIGTAFEPKMAPAMIVMAMLLEWWLVIPLLVLLGIGLVVIRKINPEYFKLLWESSITLPKRMGQHRKWDTYPFMPWFTANSLLLLTPWMILGVQSKPDILYWLPILLVMLFQAMGKVIRSSHFIPMAPWLALAGIPSPMVIILILVEMVSSGLYLGNIWQRFYGGLEETNRTAKALGLWLKDKPGKIFVNHYHAAVHIYANKPPAYGTMMVIEVHQVAVERMQKLITALNADPPQYIVGMLGYEALKLSARNYTEVFKTGIGAVWEKTK